MIYYHLIFSDNKKAVGYAWNLMGFVAKLAQGVCIIYRFCASLWLLLRHRQAGSAYVISWTCYHLPWTNVIPSVDRDGARSSKTIPEEHERRRAIFWELLNMDCRMVRIAKFHSLCIPWLRYKPYHTIIPPITVDHTFFTPKLLSGFTASCGLGWNGQ